MQPHRQRARQQIRQREQAALAVVQDVQVLDGLVDFAVFEIADPIPVVAFEQDADEGMQKMEMLGRWLQRERIDRDALLAQAELDIPATEQRGQLPVAVADVEHDRLRRVLLRVRD